MSNAAIWIDPGRQGGTPCVYGTRIPITTVAHVVSHDGIEGFQDGYGPMDRRDILVACAWWTREWRDEDRDDDKIRKAWKRWARGAWPLLCHSTEASTALVPDPPLVKL